MGYNKIYLWHYHIIVVDPHSFLTHEMRNMHMDMIYYLSAAAFIYFLMVRW
jgi:hypothetical protein